LPEPNKFVIDVAQQIGQLVLPTFFIIKNVGKNKKPLKKIIKKLEEIKT
jgi:hypothetical protein